MAIIHVNGFGTLPTPGDAVTLGTSVAGTSTWSRQTGRNGGYALRHSNSTNSASNSYTARLYLPVPLGQEFSLGVAVNHRASFTSPNNSIFGFSAAPASSGDWSVQLATGVANTYANNVGGTSAWTVVDSSATSVGWHWWNWVFKSHATSGICAVYRDGTLLAQTGTDTAPSTLLPWLSFSIWMGNANGGAQGDFGDLIIRDDASIIPDSVVTSLYPNGTSANAWVGSDGNSTDNHLLIDEETTYDPADYVGSGTLNALDTYTLGDLPNSASSVHAVQVAARAFKSDAGSRQLQTQINSQAGTATDPGGAGTVYQLATTSDGSTAWNTTSVNAATVGIKVAS